MNLHGARVLLTGASGGIGRQLVRLLASRGALLALVGRERDALAALAKVVNGAGGRVHPILFDLGQSEGHDEVARWARDALGGIDILVNNAGVSSFQSLTRETPETIRRIVAIDLLAPILLTRAVLRHLTPHGRIVNVGSMFGSIGFPHVAAYSAAKFGLRGFSEALRRELADRDIGVTYIAPRATRTRMNSLAMYRFAERTAITMDSPERAAGEIVGAIERDLKEHYVGGAEPFFARLNALLPGLLDRALRGQSRIAQQLLEEVPSSVPLR